MLVIDRNAEEYLRAKLDSMNAGEGECCLWMHRSRVQVFAQLLPDEICNLASPYITGSDPLLCVFENGDCCLVAGYLSYAAIQSISAAIENAVKADLADHILPYDLGLQYAHIKSVIEMRIKERGLKLRQQAEGEMVRQRAQKPSSNSAEIQKIREKRKNHIVPVAMIVEDDAFTRQLVYNALQDLCQAVCVEDGRQAFDFYPLFAPEILFLDIELPDIIGFEILEWIVSIDSGAYVIMLSGNGDRKSIVRSMATGAKGFIVKPFTRAKLKQYIYSSPHVQNGKGKIPL